MPRRGFTLIEALAAVLILSVGIAGVYGGLASLTRGEARLREQDLVQRLADQKYQELLATSQDLAIPTNGDFSDENYPDITWELESETTGITDLQAITVTVEIRDGDSRSPVGEASGLIYIPPVTTEGTTQ